MAWALYDFYGDIGWERQTLADDCRLILRTLIARKPRRHYFRNSLFRFVRGKNTALDLVLFAKIYPFLLHPVSEFKVLPLLLLLGLFLSFVCLFVFVFQP